MQDKITLDTFKELADQGILAAEQFVLTDHYLVVEYNGLIHKYLKEMDFDTTGEIHSYNGNNEVIVIYMNR